MKNINGILIYEKGDVLRLPKALTSLKDKKSKYGYKMAVKDGKIIFESASQGDYTRAESVRLGIPEERVPLDDNPCFGTGPCYGVGCVEGTSCQLFSDQYGGYFYCRCM